MANPCPKCGLENLRPKKYYCNECSKAYERNRWSNLSEEKRRAKWLKTKYRLSYEEYEEMYLKQDGKCSCCKIEISIKAKENGRDTACVDHCHRTKKIRSLLCNHCNRALGLIKEDTKVLKNLINYLEEHNE